MNHPKTEASKRTNNLRFSSSQCEAKFVPKRRIASQQEKRTILAILLLSWENQETSMSLMEFFERMLWTKASEQQQYTHHHSRNKMCVRQRPPIQLRISSQSLKSAEHHKIVTAERETFILLMMTKCQFAIGSLLANLLLFRKYIWMHLKRERFSDCVWNPCNQWSLCNNLLHHSKQTWCLYN